VSIQHVAAVLDSRDPRLTGTRKLVLIALANRTDDKGRCWPSQQLLADECGISIRALADHLKGLEADGFAKRSTQHLGKGNGSKTTYTLHLAALKVAPADIAGAEVAPATFDRCTGSTPHVTNHQEPTLLKADAFSKRASAPPPSIPEQPKRAGSPKSGARGSRIPSNWTPTPKDYAFASSEGMTREEINREADRFRDYWTAKTGREACKLDWSATWRNWVRSDFRKRAGSGSGTGNTSRNGSRTDAFDRLAERLSGGSVGSEPSGHYDPGAGEGDVIDVTPTRLAG